MSVLQQLSSIWPKAKPEPRYAGPWPRPGLPPHSVEANFTNPDPRMRPATILGPQLYFTKFSDRFDITPYNFPALHELCITMQKQARLDGYTFQIVKEYKGKAFVDLDKKIIGISLDQLNLNDFESIRFLIGHELGHAWQRKNKDRGNMTIREPGITVQYAHETEVDIFARCITGNAEAINRGIRAMGHGGSGKTHASTDLRTSAVALSHPIDCLHFGDAALPQFNWPSSVKHTPARQK